MLRIGTRLKAGRGSVLEFCEHGNGPSGDAEARTFFVSPAPVNFSRKILPWKLVYFVSDNPLSPVGTILQHVLTVGCHFCRYVNGSGPDVTRHVRRSDRTVVASD